MLIFEFTKTKTPLPQKGLAPIWIAPPHIHMQPRQWVVLGNEAKPMLHRVYTGHERYYRSHYNQWCCLHWCCAARQIPDRKLLPSSIYLNLNYLKWLVASDECALHLTHSNAHTQQWTHTPHPAVGPMLRIPGNWGFGQGSRLSRGIEGGENTCYSLPPTDNSCRPEIRTHNRGLQVRCSIHSATTAFMTCWHKFKDFQRSLYRVQCRQTSGVDTVTHLSRRTKATSVYDRRPSAPWVLSSAGNWSDIYTGPTSCLIVPQTFSFVFYPPSLSSVTRLAVH